MVLLPTFGTPAQVSFLFKWNISFPSLNVIDFPPFKVTYVYKEEVYEEEGAGDL